MAACASCSAELREGAKFCRACGSKVESDGAAAATAGASTGRALPSIGAAPEAMTVEVDAEPMPIPGAPVGRPVRPEPSRPAWQLPALVGGGVVALVAVVALVGVLASSGGEGGGGGGGGGTTVDLAAPTDVDLEVGDCESGQCRVTVAFTDQAEGETGFDVTFQAVDGDDDSLETAGGPVSQASGAGTARRSLPTGERFCLEVRAVAGGSRSDPASGDCFILTTDGTLVLDPLAPWQLEQDQCVAATPGSVIRSDAPEPQTRFFTDAECAFAPGTGRVFFRESPHQGGGLETCRNQGTTGQITSFVSTDDRGSPVLVCIQHG